MIIKLEITLRDSPALTELINAINGTDKEELKQEIIKLKEQLKISADKLKEAFKPNS